MSPLERILLGDEERAAFGTGSPAEAANRPDGIMKLILGLYNALGHTAKKAVGNSQTALETGNYNPAPVMEAAMLPMGTGAVAGVPLRGGEAVLGAGPIRAYHGSPHDFDKFDLKKIGTGEGAQAYGHGLYFAENKAVADGYKTSVTRNPEQLADIARAQGLTGDAAEMLAHQFTTGFGGKRFDDWIGGLRSAVDDPLLSPRVKAAAQQMLDKSVEASDAYAKMKTPGRMYEVNINADPAHFLDWDKPLAAQSGYINDKLRNVFDQSLEGREAYQSLIKDHPNSGGGMSGAGIKLGATPEAASGRFNATGIPGIKYLDQGSRGAGEGSRNYVVFDDKLIDILKKYGIVVAPPVMHPLLSGGEQKS